jgi:glycosyltransferase involved in cell wall biosynthesis
MKILLANYRYFVSGGPERYMFNVIDALKNRNHEIIPFSIRYSSNRPTPYARYFVKPLGTEDEVFFQEQRLTIPTFWRTLARLFYAPDVEKAVTLLTADTQPQVAYVLHYLRKLSPSLLVGLKKAGVPIVVRLSDYALLCPQAHCLRNRQPCELCLKNNSLWPSIRYSCVQNSFAASMLNALAMWYHRARGFFDLIDIFVTATEFMYNKMVSAGFPTKRLRCIPTFVDGTVFNSSPSFVKEDYMVYAGRIDKIKGLSVLLEALALLKHKRPELNLRLKVAGWGAKTDVDKINQDVRRFGLKEIVQFLDKLSMPQLSDLLSKAKLSILPSICYDNLPNAILESYAAGTPVLASRLGSLSECVWDGDTGYLFRTGDAGSLAKRIEYCLEHPKEMGVMSRKARNTAETFYSPERHLRALEALFSELVEEG